MLCFYSYFDDCWNCIMQAGSGCMLYYISASCALKVATLFYFTLLASTYFFIMSSDSVLFLQLSHGSVANFVLFFISYYLHISFFQAINK